MIETEKVSIMHNAKNFGDSYFPGNTSAEWRVDIFPLSPGGRGWPTLAALVRGPWGRWIPPGAGMTRTLSSNTKMPGFLHSEE